MHLRFDCPAGFYVKGSPDVNITYINATCLDNGLFETTTETCELIPCTQDSSAWTNKFQESNDLMSFLQIFDSIQVD